MLNFALVSRTYGASRRGRTSRCGKPSALNTTKAVRNRLKRIENATAKKALVENYCVDDCGSWLRAVHCGLRRARSYASLSTFRLSSVGFQISLILDCMIDMFEP